MIFPPEEILDKTKAVIVPGSHLHVYSDHLFLRKAEEWIRNLYVNYPKIKVLGICFGHQQISNALGGEVDSMRNRKKNKLGCVSTPEEIELADDFWNLDFVKKSGVSKQNSLSLYEAHGDEVTNIPETFKRFGSSKSCENEVLLSEDGRVFTMQGHPEYDVEFTCARSLNSTYADSEVSHQQMDSLLIEKVKQKGNLDNNQDEWRKICYSFLKEYYCK